jgi:haloalkane dehalogenase
MVETIVPLMERKFCDIAGCRLAYLEAGSGPPIVLLHGNPTSSLTVSHILKATTAAMNGASVA